MRVIIYGMGALGRQISDCLRNYSEELGISIVAYADKNIIEDYGYNCIQPDMLKEFDYDYIVVTSKKWFAEIKKELVDYYNVPAIKVLFFESILKDYGKLFCNVCNHHSLFFLVGGGRCINF